MVMPVGAMSATVIDTATKARTQFMKPVTLRDGPPMPPIVGLTSVAYRNQNQHTVL